MKALRKEAQVMWRLNGPTNILRLYGVCYEPPGLVFEYCNAGTLQQWLWAEVSTPDRSGRLQTTFVSTHRLADASTSTSTPSSSDSAAGKRRGQRSGDSEDDDDEDDGPPNYDALLRDGVIQGRLNSSHSLLICQELISAVAFLHSRHTAHKDIKSANVLVQRLAVSPQSAAAQPVLCVRLSDFGSARLQQSVTVAGSTLMSGGATGGTARWSAPEALTGGEDGEDQKADRSEAQHDARVDTSESTVSQAGTAPSTPDERSADVYSLGLLIAEVFTSLPPYAHLINPTKLLTAILTHRPPYDESALEAISPALLQLVHSCCAVRPRRATLTELRYQLWPRLMASLLHWDKDTTHPPAEQTRGEERAVPRKPTPIPVRPRPVLSSSTSSSPITSPPSSASPPPLRSASVVAHPAATGPSPPRLPSAAIISSSPSTQQATAEKQERLVQLSRSQMIAILEAAHQRSAPAVVDELAATTVQTTPASSVSTSSPLSAPHSHQPTVFTFPSTPAPPAAASPLVASASPSRLPSASVSQAAASPPPTLPSAEDVKQLKRLLQTNRLDEAMELATQSPQGILRGMKTIILDHLRDLLKDNLLQNIRLVVEVAKKWSPASHTTHTHNHSSSVPLAAPPLPQCPLTRCCRIR